MSFKRFDTEDIAISAESVVAPAWTGQLSTLTAVHTGSQTILSSGQYYYNIYDKNPTIYPDTAEIQFSLAYGNKNGSGSVLINPGEVGKSPSSVIYGQYRTLVNGDEDKNITFNGYEPNSIFALTVNRSRYKEKLLPASFNLTLSGSAGKIQLTDNSLDISTISYTDAGRVYELVSGSNGKAYAGSTTSGFTLNSGSYGKLLPDVGIVLLNADALKDSTQGIGLVLNESSNTSTANNQNLFNAINLGKSFVLRSEETVTSNYVFVRVRNSEFNYSTNPSNITGSGELRHTVMVNTPQSYVTTVGLYNDNNDLLGVAKLSRPLLKDFNKEALIRIKLDY